MQNKPYNKPIKNNPLESLKDLDYDGMDSYFNSEGLPQYNERDFEAKKKPVSQRKEFSVFNYQEYYERDLIKKQIKDLVELIKREIEAIKKADASLLDEVKEMQKIVLETQLEKPGIYHVRFLETVLSLLQAVRARVGESKTWLNAMVSKRKKRGSAFAAISKKKGTQFSLSQELQSARSIQ